MNILEGRHLLPNSNLFYSFKRDSLMMDGVCVTVPRYRQTLGMTASLVLMFCSLVPHHLVRPLNKVWAPHHLFSL